MDHQSTIPSVLGPNTMPSALGSFGSSGTSQKHKKPSPWPKMLMWAVVVGGVLLMVRFLIK